MINDVIADESPVAAPVVRKRGRAIVVTSGKGGVGKTTTTANLGAALAAGGAAVVLVDADVGLRNLDIVLGLEARVRHHVLDVLEEKVTLDEALVTDKRVPTLRLLAAAQTREKDDVDTEAFRGLISSLRDRFDYVLIDCPAGIEKGFHQRDRRCRRSDRRLHAGGFRGARRGPRRRAARREPFDQAHRQPPAPGAREARQDALRRRRERDPAPAAARCHRRRARRHRFDQPAANRSRSIPLRRSAKPTAPSRSESPERSPRRPRSRASVRSSTSSSGAAGNARVPPTLLRSTELQRDREGAAAPRLALRSSLARARRGRRAQDTT